jgi:hypothetical protein
MYNNTSMRDFSHTIIDDHEEEINPIASLLELGRKKTFVNA